MDRASGAGGRRTAPRARRGDQDRLPLPIDRLCRRRDVPLDDDWLDALDVGERTEENYRSKLKNHILPRWKDTPVGHITNSKARAWAKTLRQNGLAPVTASDTMKLLSLILSDAADDKLIPTNPIRSRHRALNSRLLARRNHTERLTTALHGLPDSVRAAIQQLPIDPEKAGRGRTPMAAHIYTAPIDGLLLFPTTGCPTDGCPDCTDCVNGCDTCPTCADDSPRGCDNCFPPDLTPRTAHALTVAGRVLADGCFDVVTEAWADREFLPLPHGMSKQNDDFIRRMARCFDDLADDLQDGEPPRLHNLTEQLALHLMINDAENLHSDEGDLLDKLGALLPTSRHDYDFDILFDVLFEDHDHLGYVRYDGTPDAPGTLEHLFEPFWPDQDRDPERGFRR